MERELAKLKRPAIAASALSAFGGVLLFLGWAGFGMWPLELVALVPLWLALETITGRSWKPALGVGWLYGAVAMAGGYHWMIGFTERFSGFGLIANIVIFAVFSAYLGLQYGLYGVAYFVLRQRGRGVVIAALGPLIAVEWLFPTLFPVYLANALIEVPLLAQAADIGGPLLVSAIVGLINVVVFELVRWRQGSRSAPLTLFAASSGLLAVALLYGSARIAQVEAEAVRSPSIDVGLVQVNMGVFQKQEQMAEGHRRHLEQSRELEREGPLDLLVWPESAYNYPRLGRELPIEAHAVREDLETPILFGGLSVSYDEGYRQLYNSVFLVDIEGRIEQRYDKTRLAMFGEYLPLADRFPVLHDLSPRSGSFTPGSQVEPLTLGRWRISTPVCFEATLPSLIRRMVTIGHPNVIVNLTNDAWFGDTQEPWIHLRLAQLRAIEHRRYLVRATNSGISAIIDPVGRVVSSTAIGRREHLRATVHMMSGRTLYAHLGDWPGWLSMLIAAVAFRRTGRAP
jgi:apolipoprotein N-acyltransferase